MNVRRALGVAVTVLAVASAGYAAAATLGPLGSTSLGAGSANVSSCDSNGVQSAYTVVDDAVTVVTISGIHGNCLNGALSVALTDADGAAIGTAGPQVVDGPSMDLIIGGQPLAEDVTGIHVAITGS
jgi:hypothetical protein